MNVWLGDTPVAELFAVSPKVHAYVSGPPSGSLLAAALNVQTRLVQDSVNEATGGTGGGATTVTLAVAVAWPPRSSVTVTVADCRPAPENV